ncbi:MAG: O-antigen ligase family protein [Saprospiraceae bacterium]|nr:O-antigen ligase family protein [Saprospiraceae bacterium]
MRSLLTSKFSDISWNPASPSGQFSWFISLCILSLFASIITGEWLLAGAPAFVALFFLTLVDFRKVFYLLLICIPISSEVHLSNGFGTDLPTEPLMVGIMLVYFLYLIRHGKAMDARFFRHPITLLLLLHLGWIACTTLTSASFFISFKYLLAKTWYIITFYFMAGWLLKTEEDFKKLFWLILLPLLFTVVIIVGRHATFGFSFADVNKILTPFQRNHVNYAATLALFSPFVAFALFWNKAFSKRWWFILGAGLFLLFATYTTYTRAAFVAIFMAVGAYFIIQLRLVRYVLMAGLVAAVLAISYLAFNNRYLDLAPNFDTTVTHYEFDNLLEATYKMEDISTMERVYRWVAGFQMSNEKPWLGYGPGNFTTFYRSYTITSFQTYVSNNPDNSGVHSYFLMTLIEQGIIGLLIFVLLTFAFLIYGEKVYHQTSHPTRRWIIMTLLLCIVIIDAFLIINDLVETDKVGSFFFMCMAMLVNMDLLNQKEESATLT